MSPPANKKRLICLAMAYQGEPLKRVVNGLRGDIIYLVREDYQQDADAGVGFPENCVFHWDAQLFDKIDKAFKAGDAESLKGSWKQAIPLKLRWEAIPSITETSSKA